MRSDLGDFYTGLDKPGKLGYNIKLIKHYVFSDGGRDEV